MKLMLKFNVVFVLAFIAGLYAASYVSWNLLQKNAREEVVQNARLVMETALAMRAYTSNQVRPLLETQMKYTFLPQSVPAYSATEVLNGLRKNFPDYAYKEATLNPTNPRNRAADWEADIVHQFRNGAEAAEIVGERDTPAGRSFYIARPIKIANDACLYCHSTVDAAPKTMIDKYGPANGFGWKLNEIVGAQIVALPTTIPYERANRAYHTFMFSLTIVFVAIAIALNLMLYFTVIRPVTRLSKLADQVSLGNLDVPELAVNRRDEIGTLGQSFNRMRNSLVEAMRMLEA